MTVAVGSVEATGQGVKVAQATVEVGCTVRAGRGVYVGKARVGTFDVGVGVDHHGVGVGVFTEACPGVPVGLALGSAVGVSMIAVGCGVGRRRVGWTSGVDVDGSMVKVGVTRARPPGVTGSVGRGPAVAPGTGRIGVRVAPAGGVTLRRGRTPGVDVDAGESAPAVGAGATAGGCCVAVGDAGATGVGVLTAAGSEVEVGMRRVGLGALVGVRFGPMTTESDCPARAKA